MAGVKVFEATSRHALSGTTARADIGAKGAASSCRAKGRKCHHVLPPKGQNSDNVALAQANPRRGQVTPVEATSKTNLRTVLETVEESNLMCIRTFPV